MSGPLPKAHGRQRTNTPALGELVPIAGGVVDLPEPSKLWLPETRSDWEGLWRAPLAQAYTPETDLPALRRLFALRDERSRALMAYKRKRTAKGSMGQDILNPVVGTIPAMDTQITALEDRFGLTPSSRLKLGIVFAEGSKRMAGMFDEEADDGDDGTFDGL